MHGVCRSQVKELHYSGVLAKARYLCSNSGGSWFNTAFSYQSKVPVDVFLGPREVEPERLTVGLLANSSRGSFAGKRA